MSELGKFVRARNLNNVSNGIIKITRDGNVLLYDVQMPDGRLLTLPSAKQLNLVVGDVVQVVMPSGNSRQAFVSELSAVVLGDDPINKLLGLGVG